MRIDIVVMLGIAGVAATYAFATLRIPVSGISDPVGPRAFPLLIVAALVVTIALVMNEARRSAPARQPAGDQASGAMQGARVTAGVIALSGLFILALQPLGFVIAGTAYAFALMAWLNRGRWAVNAVTALVFCLGLHVLLTRLMGANLPKGLLGW